MYQWTSNTRHLVCSFESLLLQTLLAAIILCNYISWTASSQQFEENVEDIVLSSGSRPGSTSSKELKSEFTSESGSSNEPTESTKTLIIEASGTGEISKTEVTSDITNSATETRESSNLPVNTRLSGLSILCEADGYPTPEVYWTKDDQVLEPSERVQLSDTRLTISRLSPRDSGVYACHAHNLYTSHYSTLQVSIGATDASREAKAELILPISSPVLPPVTTSTLRAPLAPKRTPPQSEKGCTLTYDSQYNAGDPEKGYRFGARNDSRIEYARLPGSQHDSFDLTVTLRTSDQHGGLIFYAAAEKVPQQFLALYMKEGRLYLSFNCGSHTEEVVSSQTYIGTEWHTVTLVKNGGRGKLSVDSQLVGESSGDCLAPGTLAAPFYYGGLRDFTDDIKQNLNGFYQPFKGCLKGLLMNGQQVTDIMHRVNSLQCCDSVEDGVYFGPSTPVNSNYLRLSENFRVGYHISVSMEIKPRNLTGLLLSVHGRKDFMVLEMLENEVIVTVENGKGPFNASFKLRNKTSLCDGNWHKIIAVKSRHVVTVGVDGHLADPGLGMGRSTDTKSALMIGGHERPLGRLRGVRSRRGFTGCLRNIVINDSTVQIPPNAAHGNIQIGVCPQD